MSLLERGVVRGKAPDELIVLQRERHLNAMHGGDTNTTGPIDDVVDQPQTEESVGIL